MSNAKWAFKVEATEHDNNSPSAVFFRETKDLANRTANLMRECGYQDVSVKAFLLNPTECFDIPTGQISKEARELVA